MIHAQQILKINRFPKNLNIQFDYQLENPPSNLPFVLEEEIDLSYFGYKPSKLDYSNTGVDLKEKDKEENLENSTQTKDSKITEIKKGKTFGLGFFKRAKKPDDKIKESDFANAQVTSLVINSLKSENFKYQLNSFSLPRHKSKNIYEMVSYIKISNEWFEFSSKGVCEIDKIENLLKTLSCIPHFLSYSLIQDTKPALEKEELKQLLADENMNKNFAEKTFYMPDNFVNRFSFIDSDCRQVVEDKFCQHAKLKPDYNDVVFSTRKYNLNEKSEDLKEDKAQPAQIFKNAELIDGSFASLKYFANSKEIPLSLAKKFVFGNQSVNSSYILDLEQLNYFQACNECTSNRKDRMLRRVLEKSLIFNFLKAPDMKTEKKYLVDSNWFKQYRNFLIADLSLFSFKRQTILECEAPSARLNSSTKQRLIEFRENNKTDKKISEDHFIKMDKKFYCFLQTLYKSENCLLFDNKSIYIDNSDSNDTNLLYTVEEKYVIDKIEEIVCRGCNFNKATQAQLYDLNKKLNVLIEFAMDTCFIQLFQDIELSRDVINKYLPKALSKFVRFFDKHQTDFLTFDPCKVIFNIFNQSEFESNGKTNTKKNYYFPSNSKLSSAGNNKPVDFNNSIFYESALKNQQKRENNLVHSSLSTPLSQNKDIKCSPLVSDLNAKIETSEHNKDQRDYPNINESTLNSFYVKENNFEAAGTSILHQSNLDESDIIKMMNHSTLDRVYNNGANSKPKKSIAIESLINHISINSQIGRDSVSSCESRSSKELKKSFTKKNIVNLLKNAQNIMVLNDSMNRDTIQLDDSFNYQFEINSFFSENPLIRETVNEATSEKDQNGKKESFNLNQMDVLTELSEDSSSEAGSVKNELNFQNDRNDEGDNSEEFNSKIPKKSRFCNPKNINIIGESDDDQFESEQSEEDSHYQRKSNHEQQMSQKRQSEETILKIIKRNSKEIIKNGTCNVILNASTVVITNSSQALKNHSPKEAKTDNSLPKQEFFLMIKKEPKPVEEPVVINLSFVNRSSVLESENEEKNLSSSSQLMETPLFKSQMIESIKEEESENESSEEEKPYATENNINKPQFKELDDKRPNRNTEGHQIEADPANKSPINSKNQQNTKPKAKGKENNFNY
jgi:hypothetical protein